jgi:Zn-dependent protease
MFRSYRIGRIFGFPIEVNLSFLLLLGFALVWMGGLAGAFVILVAFASVLLHELGHALMARSLGVPVAGIELHFFGGAAKMAQPRKRGDEIVIAAAGPAVSFALGGLGFVLYAVTGAWPLATFAWINTIIGTFNLIPALPMDGGRIFRALLSGRTGYQKATEIAVTVARGFAILLGVVGVVTLHLYLVALAVVLWLMSAAELQLARRGFGYGQSRTAQAMPRGFDIGRRDGIHRPVQSGGFVVRARNGRFYIETID